MNFIDNEFRRFPELYDYINRNRNDMLSLLFKNFEDDEKTAIVEWIIENKISDKKDRIWENLLKSFEKSSLFAIANVLFLIISSLFALMLICSKLSLKFNSFFKAIFFSSFIL